ncbi:hypothetical protein AAHC03_014049 [Spirometra sp. Aus1]
MRTQDPVGKIPRRLVNFAVARKYPATKVFTQTDLCGKPCPSNWGVLQKVQIHQLQRVHLNKTAFSNGRTLIRINPNLGKTMLQSEVQQ